MKVFKFGGASVKNSESIRNILNIISSYNTNDLIVVVSAMDKTTNALEEVVKMYLENNQEYIHKVDEIFNFHEGICLDLFPKTHDVFSGLRKLITKIILFLKLCFY